MSSVEFCNIVKRFGTNEIIPLFNLNIKSGKLTLLLGPSGCGKSTLLRLIAGLESPDDGSILIDGVDITATEPRKRGVAMVFQNYALYPHLTVKENLAFPLKVARITRGKIEKKVAAIAEMLGLTSMLDRYPKTLSGGERQRTAVGRAIVREPKLFLFDEPLSNLDFQLRSQMRGELVSLQRKLGKTMVYVTHDQTEGMTMADTLVVLNKGKIMQVGNPDTIYNQPANLFTAQFIGSPKMNIFNARVRDGNLYLDQTNLMLCRTKMPDSRYKAGIRPEHLLVEKSDNAILCNMLYSEFHGSSSYLTCKVEEHTFCALAQTAKISNREEIGLRFQSELLHYFNSETGERL